LRGIVLKMQLPGNGNLMEAMQLGLLIDGDQEVLFCRLILCLCGQNVHDSMKCKLPVAN